MNDDQLNSEIEKIANLMVHDDLSSDEQDPIKLEKDSYAMRVLKQQVSSYFDTFISKTINNWAVVIENHFRFNINQKRIIECILTLTGQL